MVRRCAVLMVGTLFMVAGSAKAQDNARDALIEILLGSQSQGALDPDVIAAVAVVLSAEAETFPLASSSGGFTWTFDPALGVQTRRTQSFGPMFAERPFTNGRRKLNVGVAYQHTAYDSLAGQPLSGLTTIIRPSQAQAFTVQGTYNSSLEFKTDRTIISASYGVSDRVDLSVLVPIERTRAFGSNSSSRTAVNVPANFCLFQTDLNGSFIQDLCNRSNSVTNLAIPPGQCAIRGDGVLLCSVPVKNISGTSSGIGDVIVRGKFGLVSMPVLDLAAGIDVRLPTGDADALLGVGKTQTKLMVMGSSTHGIFAPHFNVGYTFSGKGLPFNSSGTLLDSDGSLTDAFFDSSGGFKSSGFASDEFNYVFGADVAINQVITVMGDVIGRSLKNSAKFEFVTAGSSVFKVSPATLNLILGTVGTKIKIGNDFLFTASAVFPLNSAGIKPGITPVVGFERAF